VSPASRREQSRLATGVALRRAAFELFGRQGYAATTTEQIAHAAGVSARTFFNYFPSKEELFLLPGQPLAGRISATIRSRPPGEDPVLSVTVAAMDTFRMMALVASTDHFDIFLASLSLMLNEPDCRAFLDERRQIAERATWQALVDRGVSSDDLATRAALSAIVAAGFVALAAWVEKDGKEPLPALLVRCLVGLPEPTRLAAGLVAPGLVGDTPSVG